MLLLKCHPRVLIKKSANVSFSVFIVRRKFLGLRYKNIVINIFIVIYDYLYNIFLYFFPDKTFKAKGPGDEFVVYIE